MKFPKWLPREITEWFGSNPREPKPIFVRLATSDAMWEVWEWYSAGRPHSIKKSVFIDENDELLTISSEEPTPIQFLSRMAGSRSFPGKPSNMTPKARNAYLGKVKKHAAVLIELLQDTEYDRSIFDEFGFLDERIKPLDPENLKGKIVEDIRSMIDFCTSVDCILQADYLVDQSGDVYRRGWNYPNSDLVHTLRHLIDWASQDDYFNMLHSVKHLRQSGIQARKTHCLAKLDAAFEEIGMTAPFAHYATIANVVLDLPDSESLDEDSARKQIARIRQRRAESEPPDSEAEF